MRILARLPLYRKILVWFALNLAVLVVVLLVVLGVRLRLSPDSMLAGSSAEETRNAARLISRELVVGQDANWSEVMDRYAEVFARPVVLIAPGGKVVASGGASPPTELIDAARDRLPPPPAQPAATTGRRPPPRQPGASPPPGAVGEPGAFHVISDGMRWTAMMLRLDDARGHPRPAVLAVGRAATLRALASEAAPVLAVVALALVVSALWWWPFVRSLTRPLGEMTVATERIARGRFDVALDETGRDEIGRLARAVNRMARRLEHYVHGQRRFLGDVAHELGSPLGRMQLGLGVLERRVDGENRQRVTEMLEEAEHLAGLVGELLSFTRAEIDPSKARLEDVRLRPLVERAAGREAEPDTTIEVDVDEALAVHADPELVVRALANVVRNAVRYAGHAGPIDVSARREGHEVVLVVADRGPGVEESALPHLFEPFYRPDSSRANATGGAGLGLSIVKTCVEACGGGANAHNREAEERGGFVVELRLPAARSA